MVEAIFWIVISGLSLFGLVELLGILDRKLVYFEQEYCVYSLIPLKGHVEETDLLIKEVARNLEHMEKDFSHKIVIVDMGMDEETAKICRLAQKEHEELVMCKVKDLEKIIVCHPDLQIQ